MFVKERIVAIRLAERIARNREYADEIGVFVMNSKAEDRGGEREMSQMKGKDGYYGSKSRAANR